MIYQYIELNRYALGISRLIHKSCKTGHLSIAHFFRQTYKMS